MSVHLLCYVIMSVSFILHTTDCNNDVRHSCADAI